MTEIHPGNYIYYDEMQKLLGSCEAKDIAVRVLTRVIGKYPEQNMLLVDMGWTGCSAQGDKEGYGRIAGKEHSNLHIKVLKQEAGEVESRDGTPIDFSKYPIGTMLGLFLIIRALQHIATIKFISSKQKKAQQSCLHGRYARMVRPRINSFKYRVFNV